MKGQLCENGRLCTQYVTNGPRSESASSCPRNTDTVVTVHPHALRLMIRSPLIFIAQTYWPYLECQYSSTLTQGENPQG